LPIRSIKRRRFEPEPGVKVKSKIEYVIYRELQAAREAGRLSFTYEQEMELPINGRRVRVRPDFTIVCNGKTFYWEHLGMLDREDYSRNWRARLEGYRVQGLSDVLVTTDDLGGIREGQLCQVVDCIVAGRLTGTGGEAGFSQHHYSL
jgi:exodeoxyribonuclease V alpha subunit